MAAAPVLLSDPSSLAHNPSPSIPHPEQPARMVAIERELEARGWLGYERVRSPAAARSALTAVHPEAFVAGIESAATRGGAQIDADTVVSPGSFLAAAHAAGGAVELVDRLLSGAAPTGFSVHRPPGHHAERARAMGFCLFNNVAVAARHALSDAGCERVMIVDWDVHHGNGTNAIFHEDPRVLFVSLHQSPLYPGTGSPGDLGSGDGLGFTVNLPVAPGAGDEVFCSLVDGVAVPLARSFAPQLLLISAGFDAHAEDPLADCAVTDTGFATMAAALRDVGAELACPVGGMLEGGYALLALGRSVAETMAALAGPAVVSRGSASARLLPEVAAARERLTPWWPDLGGEGLAS
ncbi:MAG: histone deacetylase family protein [Solirubrobacteraceae bacterium]